MIISIPFQLIIFACLNIPKTHAVTIYKCMVEGADGSTLCF